MPGPRTAASLTCLAAAALLGCAPAQATPPSGVSATVLGESTSDQHYVMREITIAPGGSTGWHFHDGPLYAAVRSGTLTHELADCTTVHTYSPGDLVIEASGPSAVHIGRNLGTEDVVLDVLYVLPEGSPYSQDAADPGCA